MRLKIDWANLILGRKFIVFLCFTLYLRAISKYKPLGGLYLEGRFNGGFFALEVWGAYTWRGLFSEFYGIFVQVTYHFQIWQFYRFQGALSISVKGFSVTGPCQKLK